MGWWQAVRRSGELERAVMDALWEADAPRTAKQVLAALPGRGLAHTTVITVLDRLARKGTVVRERIGRSWHYTPATSRESHISALMMDVLAQAGDRDAALIHFARAVSGPDADVLRQALQRATEEDGRATEEDGRAAERDGRAAERDGRGAGGDGP